MNPATTTVKRDTLRNEINFTEPFTLFLGRKGRMIEDLARLEFLQQYETFHDEDDPFGPISPSRLVSEKVSLFISNNLYATIRILPGRKRHPIKIVKPDSGPMEVHLIKRYTRLV